MSHRRRIFDVLMVSTKVYEAIKIVRQWKVKKSGRRDILNNIFRYNDTLDKKF
jgi:hypothetical protein